jgi:predicted permease
MGIGYFAAKTGMMPRETRKKLSDMFINIILPCNIVVSFMVEFNTDTLKKSGQILVIALAAQTLFLVLSKILYRFIEPRKSAIVQYGTICSNAGFMGNPIAYGIFGQEGLLYASISLIPLRFFMWSAGLSLFTKPNRRTVIKLLATHPCIIAVWLGFALMISQVNLPGFIVNTLTACSNCTTAVSMIVIGAILADVDLRGGPSVFFDKVLLYFSFIRLIAIPGLLWLVMTFLALPGILTGVTVLLAAMPAGSTTAMLAEKYGGDADFASRCVFLSTLLSMLTLPLWGLVLL